MERTTQPVNKMTNSNTTADHFDSFEDFMFVPQPPSPAPVVPKVEVIDKCINEVTTPLKGAVKTVSSQTNQKRSKHTRDEAYVTHKEVQAWLDNVEPTIPEILVPTHTPQTKILWSTGRWGRKPFYPSVEQIIVANKKEKARIQAERDVDRFIGLSFLSGFVVLLLICGVKIYFPERGNSSQTPPITHHV